MRIASVFDNLPKSCLICKLIVIIYIYNITKWDELSSESGASCLRASYSWDELSCFPAKRNQSGDEGSLPALNFSSFPVKYSPKMIV